MNDFKDYTKNKEKNRYDITEFISALDTTKNENLIKSADIINKYLNKKIKKDKAIHDLDKLVDDSILMKFGLLNRFKIMKHLIFSRGEKIMAQEENLESFLKMLLG